MRLLSFVTSSSSSSVLAARGGEATFDGLKSLGILLVRTDYPVFLLIGESQ